MFGCWSILGRLRHKRKRNADASIQYDVPLSIIAIIARCSFMSSYYMFGKEMRGGVTDVYITTLDFQSVFC